MKIAFHTLGCKVNQYETEALKNNLSAKGYEIATDEGAIDIYIINTCTVTSLADRKSRQYIRRAKKLNPHSVIAVTGCYAQVSPEEAAGIEGVDIVVGNEDKMNIPEQLEKFFADKPVQNGSKSQDAGNALLDASKLNESVMSEYELLQNADEYFEIGIISEVGSRTRAFIKVQDGCDRFCSYCIIPYARGKLQSRPLESIVSEARNLIDKGFKEIVLTGINTALYGVESSFSDDIESVIKALNSLAGDFRIRLSSLEPTVIDASYIKKLFKYEKLCHHIHLSLQSGSDKILKSMNRRYSMDEYMQIIKVLTEFDPEYGISTDIIVGFPEETNEDFEESLKITENIDFCKVHVFKYSNRKGTTASTMRGQIDGTEKSKRSAVLITAGDTSAVRFFEKNLNKEKKVLIEEFVEDLGCYTGYTDNYIKAYIHKTHLQSEHFNCNHANNGTANSNHITGNRSSSDNIDKYVNEFVNVRLTEIFEDGMLAEPIEFETKEEKKMSNCIFCKIVNKEIPANVMYEDDKVLCFHDITPKAPVHVLLIPKKHIVSMDDVRPEDQELMGYMIVKIKEIAETLDLENGYRVVNNCKKDGGQTVDHLHFHILGKRQMMWPPG